MGALVRYDKACRAIAEAKSVDEAKNIRDKAEAMRAYARQAKNRQLEIDAAEIRFLAERRLGELMQAQRETVGLNAGTKAQLIGRSETDPPIDERPTLAEAGIDKRLADRARKLAAIPREQFDTILNGWRKRMEKETDRVTIDLLRAGDKAQRRARREAELAQKIAALPAKKYGVIVADPEWRFEPWSRTTGMDRAADNHYPTSVTEAIAARPVGDIAADDSVLFLWATVPMLPHALAVMEAWGFGYRTNFCWTKDRIGMGYWNRNRHELFLLGVRGAVPTPSPGAQWNSLIEAPTGAHSEKPAKFMEMIEAYFPTLPKIELNCRGAPRPGWDAWGNEVLADST